MRVSTLLILLPTFVIAAILGVANRRDVTLSFDPLSDSYPAFAITAPLFILIFGTLIVGFLLGWAMAVVGRVRRRRATTAPPVADHVLPETRARRNP